MNRNEFFTCGPFKESQDKLDSFAFGVFYLQCLGDTLEEITKLEAEYEVAVEQSDAPAAAEKKKALDYYRGMLLMASDIRESWRGENGRIQND